MRITNSYRLSLANGQKWDILGSEEILPWLEQFASIMRLKRTKPNGYSRMTFVNDARQVKRDRGFKELKSNLIKFYFDAESKDTICEIDSNGTEDPALYFLKMSFALYPAYERALDDGGLPLHSALIEKDGRGILLVGSGSTGKSTCCHRLPENWNALCDDEALIVKDKESNYFAHPMPTWSDYIWRNSKKTFDVQRHLPLSAIFFLEKSVTDRVVPIGNGMAAVLIYKSTEQVFDKVCRKFERKKKSVLKERLFKSGCELAKTVPSFILKVSLTGRFWEEIEKVF